LWNSEWNHTISVLACPKIIGDLCIVERVRQAFFEALPRKPLAVFEALPRKSVSPQQSLKTSFHFAFGSRDL
jgi:hypothetical protein